MKLGSARQPELPAEQIATIVDWIDGSLSAEAALEFELCLTADPELAARVEAFADLDAQMRRELCTPGVRARARPHWGVWTALAAAALVVIAVLPRFLASPAPTFEVALAPSFALAEDWTLQSAELKGSCAPGIAMARGENPTQLSPEEFLRRAALTETAVVAQALESGQRELEAGWFVVPIELSAPASVVVLGFSQSAPTLRLFPDPKVADPTKEASRLAAGRQLLPGARARFARSAQTIDYRPGFLVPLGTQELVVLVGVREAEIDTASLAELDGWIAGEKSVDSAAARLAKAGFSVQRLSVREPK